MSLISLYKRKNKKLLFTTPSHSQKFFIFHKFYQFYKYDISETEAHDPELALSKAEENAAKIYKTKHTYFLTNGSSSGIIAAVLSCTKKGDKVLIWEHAHQSHTNAVKLSGCIPVFYSINKIKYWGVYGKTILSPDQLKDVKAVIVTSPTYEGIVSDIRSINKLCRECGAYLSVDEAHGALYPFSDKLPESSVEIADFTIQSLHKTAGGLNPTALLHVNCDIDASNALSMINTTSPSYPLLTSIEANINFLNSNRGKIQLNKLIDSIINLKKNVNNVEFFGDDITKILIKHNKYSGYELSEILFDKFNIEDEKTNDISTMLLCGIGTTSKKIEMLKKALKKL